MLNGKELGQAIEAAYQLKKASGAISSKADIARHFKIKTPSVYDWVKKGSISKDKLPELWHYFSDVVGPEHWGLAEWPCVLKQGYPSSDEATQQHEVREPSSARRGYGDATRAAYERADEETKALVDAILGVEKTAPPWMNQTASRFLDGLLADIKEWMSERKKKTAA